MKLDRRSFLRGGLSLAAVSVSGATVAYASKHVPVPSITHSGQTLHVNADGCTALELYNYMADAMRSEVDYIF